MNKRRHNSRLFRKPVNLFKIENGIFYCGKPSNGWREVNLRTILILVALLVQLVERRSPKPDVVGSSPTGREMIFMKQSLVS